ncbi:hypothetical protein AB0I84_38725 [Streptomyces spectabilis]|uniref:hypothetical protein n=1 Tax=Streptomyces spectabilis TaxID=68270 RepID=UPI0033C86FAB
MDTFTMLCPNHQGDDCWACQGTGKITFTGEEADRAAQTMAQIDRWAERRESEQ